MEASTEDVKATRAEKMALAREAARLKEEPFKTMVTEGLKDTTIDALRGWKPPNGAYVLLEQRKNFIQQDQSLKPGTALNTMWVEDRPEQIERLRRNIRKGCRVIHFGFFPSANETNPQRLAKYKMHTNVNGINAYDALKQEVLQAINGDQTGAMQKLEREKQALELKLQEALKKNAK